MNYPTRIILAIAASGSVVLPALAMTNTNPGLIDPATGFTATGSGATVASHVSAIKKKSTAHRAAKTVVKKKATKKTTKKVAKTSRKKTKAATIAKTTKTVKTKKTTPAQ